MRIPIASPPSTPPMIAPVLAKAPLVLALSVAPDCARELLVMLVVTDTPRETTGAATVV
jgi:hypothetical protein